MSTVINTNIASVIAQRSLANTSVQMSTALQRLSTGQCDPAGGAQPAALILRPGRGLTSRHARPRGFCTRCGDSFIPAPRGS